MATPSSCHVESSILRFENSPESQHLSGLVLAEALPEFISDGEEQAGEVGEIEPTQAVAAE
jgi:hypothetical protein